MGTTVPSGRVVVAGPAVKLTWPKPITVAKRRNTLTTAAAFNVALHLQSLIRIMVLASRRRRSVLDINRMLVRHPPAGGAQTDGFARQATPCPYCDSSIANSRESTSSIINMPPGKTLFVVISRSLCECHMKAQPRSLAGLTCRFAGCNVVQLVRGVAVPVVAVLVQVGILARKLASGPR